MTARDERESEKEMEKGRDRGSEIDSVMDYSVWQSVTFGSRML